MQMQICENTIEEKSFEEPVWFAMSAPFGRVLKAKAFLDSNFVECFVPMRYKIVNDRNQCKKRKLVPAISNLIFVYTTKERIQSLKAQVEYLQYLTQPIGGRNVPIIVPEYQMQQFIAVCNTYNEKLVYLSPNEINLKEGTRVKIIGSTFDGIEGRFVKVDKGRKKRVVVLVHGIAAVMIAEFTDGYVQVIE